MHLNKQNIRAALVGLCAAAVFGVALTQMGLVSHSSFFSGGSATNDHTITLDGTNAVSSAGDFKKKTFEGNDVTFTYYNVTSGGHTTLNAGGYLVNKDQITSIQAISSTFSGSGTLKFKVSYDGSTWGEETTMESNYRYELGSNPYYVQFTAYSNSIRIDSILFNYSCVANPNAAGHQVIDEGETYYQKVANADSFSGEYLIVYEEGEKAFNGDLDTLDATDNYVDVEIDEERIDGSDDINDAVFTFASVEGGYSIRSHSGYYIGNDSNTNKLVASDSAITNTVSVSEGDFSAVSYSSHLRFNSANDQLRFRYFKSSSYTGQQAISLYQKVTTQGGSHTEYDAPDADIIGFTASDSKASIYKTTDIFDTANGLTVYANKTGDTTEPLTLGGTDGYSYVVKDSLGNPIDTSQPFGGLTDGTYTLIVSYKNFIPQEIELNVTFVVALTSISDFSVSLGALNTANRLSEVDLSNLTAILHYNNGNQQELHYSDLSDQNCEVQLLLLTPSGVTYDQTAIFGAAGNWTLKLVSKTNASIFAESEFTVSAIPVQAVEMSNATAEIEIGGTVQLTVSVTPNNATNKNVEWLSSNESVATVSDNGLVTGVAIGEATITARAITDNTKYGTCTVTVTEPVAGPDEGEFTLATGSLTVGSYVVFASSYNGGNDYAMSTTQNTNNRPGESVEIENETITRDSESSFRAFKVEEGTTNDTFAFYDEEVDGYLYAASSSSNQLKTEGTKTANSSWTISGSESKTVTAQGSNSRNLLRWNSSAKIFSCYGSGQVNPYIFEKAGDPVYPTSLSISGDSTVSVGGTTTLSVSFVPNDATVKNVVWTSSNDTIAGVENGVVTGIKAGQVTITATGYNGISDTHIITVQNVAVSSVSLNKAALSLNKDASDTLTATISPANATNKNVTWSTSNNSVATVDNGVVKAVGAGEATITVTTQDGSKTASCTVTVTDNSGNSATDVIDNAATSGDLGSTSTSTWVSDFSISGSSGATYLIHSMGTNGGSHALQWNTNGWLRSTVSGGVVTSVTINANAGKTLNIDLGSSTITSNGGGSEHGSITGSGTYNAVGSYEYIRIYGGSSSTQVSSITIQYGTPEPVDPTALAVTPSAANVSPGGSKTLSVTYTPSGANQNKAVTWSSSNNSVATVDTSGKVTVSNNAIAGQTATITATLTNLPSIKNTCTITVVEQAKADHTVLVYICGSNLESNSSNRLATGDIREMLSVSGQPDDVNIVIETGGAKSWASTYGISSTYLQRHHVANKKLVTDESSIEYASMGLTSTLQSFIEYGLTNYPADRVGLVLWNHGGAMRGVCYDEKKNDDNLLDYEVKNAVSGALSNKGMSGQKLEWIGYDACLMQVQDIAEMNSAYFNYMVASEESEAGYGWDYDNWVDDLYAKKTTPNILKAVVDSFIADNGGTGSSGNDQTLSYLTLSYAAAYKTAWENMAAQLQSKLTSSNKGSFNTLVKSCKYYADTDYTYFGLFDAKDFINKLSSNGTFNPGSSYTSAVLTAHSNLVTYSSCGKGAGNSHGLAMFWSAASDSGKATYYTASHTNFSTWRSIVSTYGS